MKKLLFLLLFLPVMIFAQTEITSLGKLHLGDSINIVDQLGYKKHVQIKTKEDFVRKFQCGTSKNCYYEFVPDSTVIIVPDITSCDIRLKVFYFPEVELISTLTIKRVWLRFFNERLVTIMSDGSDELKDALTVKYGTPKDDMQQEEHEFTYQYTGAKFKKTDRTFTWKWESYNPHITCNETLKSWYDSNADHHSYYSFSLEDNSFLSVISKREKEIIQRAKESELQQKKKTYSGF